MQVTGDNEAVAAVVARAADDRNTVCGREALPDLVRRREAGAPGREVLGRIGAREAVRTLALGEHPVGKARALLERRPHAIDLDHVDADPHRLSLDGSSRASTATIQSRPHGECLTPII